MKKLILGIAAAAVLTSNVVANECPSVEERIAFGTIGVLQGAVLGGPVGALWGFGTVVFADAYNKDCNENNTLKEVLKETKEINQDTEVKNKEPIVEKQTAHNDYENIISKEDKKSETLETLFVESFVNFGYDRYSVNKLNVSIESLKLEKAKKVVVEGHTDSKGTNEYNFALGLKRANAVKKVLASSIDPNKIYIVSYGESAPLSDDDAQNRRADIKVIYTEQGE